jgi:hypothetical protein
MFWDEFWVFGKNGDSGKMNFFRQNLIFGENWVFEKKCAFLPFFLKIVSGRVFWPEIFSSTFFNQN